MGLRSELCRSKRRNRGANRWRRGSLWPGQPGGQSRARWGARRGNAGLLWFALSAGTTPQVPQSLMPGSSWPAVGSASLPPYAELTRVLHSFGNADGWLRGDADGNRNFHLSLNRKS